MHPAWWSLVCLTDLIILREYNDLPGTLGKWEVSTAYNVDKVCEKAWQGSGDGEEE